MTAAWRSATCTRATSSSTPTPCARPCSAAGPTTSGPPTRRMREVVEELLAGVSLDRAVLGPLRWRAPPLLAGRAAARRARPDRARRAHQPPRRRGRRLARRPPRRSAPSALVVVTHDRWFLDEVCQTTWEVHDGVVDAYEGGYAAFVLAKAERQRQAAASRAASPEPRPQGAGLAAPRRPGAHLEAEVPHRRRQRADRGRAAAARPARAAAVRHPAARQGRHRHRGRRPRRAASGSCSPHATWRLGPGDRVGLVGVNGAGKTSVLSLIAGDLAPTRRPGQARPHGRAASTSPRRSTRSTPTAGCCRRRGDRAGHPHRDGPTSPRPRCSSASASPATSSPPGSATSPVASAAASSCSSCCSTSPTCCCSTSPPTTSTSRPSTSSRTSSTAGPAP